MCQVNISKDSYEVNTYPFCQAQVQVPFQVPFQVPGQVQVQSRSGPAQVLTWTWTWTKFLDLG